MQYMFFTKGSFILFGFYNGFYGYDLFQYLSSLSSPRPTVEMSGHIYAPLIDKSLKSGIDSGVEGTPTLLMENVTKIHGISILI